jgi:hypothetical protein
MKRQDMLMIDYANLDEHIAKYTEEHGEAPTHLVIDNFSIWDLVAQLNGEKDPKLAEESLLKGTDAFVKDTELRGLSVRVMIGNGKRFAELTDLDGVEELAKRCGHND